MERSSAEIMPLTLSTLQQSRIEHYSRLSAASRSQRFMGSISDEALTCFAQQSRPDLTLAIERDSAPRAMLELYFGENKHAEVGLSVEDAYQGCGLGRTLFERGLSEARAHNMLTVDVIFVRSNIAMHKLCVDEGGDVECIGSECTAQLRTDCEQFANLAKTEGVQT
ncbi:GNAT family N-acetyltransferase [Sulfitobacter pontiacus]|uniref:GNAT family N-acetyltransferase n=1 Tax=Sulfitobacter pontiacus TaxID=60137 RepID=UPI0030ED3B30